MRGAETKGQRKLRELTSVQQDRDNLNERISKFRHLVCCLFTYTYVFLQPRLPVKFEQQHILILLGKMDVLLVKINFKND